MSAKECKANVWYPLGGTGTEVVMETNSSLPAPKIVNNIAAARRTIADARKDGATVGLVPTMGSFHLGHISLMSAARTDCDFVAVSIFVNPSQYALDE
jgi:bifunctional ADP-heptose synthase (sugar kinase/adenylyltransferase)